MQWFCVSLSLGVCVYLLLSLCRSLSITVTLACMHSLFHFRSHSPLKRTLHPLSLRVGSVCLSLTHTNFLCFSLLCLWLSLCLSLSLAFSLSLSVSRALLVYESDYKSVLYQFCLSLSRSHTHTVSLSLSLFLFLSYTHTLSLSLSLSLSVYESSRITRA